MQNNTIRDGRAPLFGHSLILGYVPENKFEVWNAGVRVSTDIDISGLEALGDRFEKDDIPEWYNGDEGDWGYPESGRVLKALAKKAAEIGCKQALTRFYGGNINGPANPDLRKAGLVINIDNGTLNWREPT